ncbi:MAG: DUF58 domain-containing protein [Oscillospiraceae bacterium]|nr:DUF58 domain-containing protein [Oscillospiraceae bacterium]
MKAARVGFYGLLTVCLIMGLYTGVRIFFTIFLCGIFLIIATILLNVFTIYSFRFLQEIARSKCVKGEKNGLELDLRNETILPLSMMSIHVEVASPSEKVDLVINLSPFSGRKFNVPMELPYRGFYRVGMTKIKINDIFGLVPFRFDMRHLSYYRMKELLVLPKVNLLDPRQIEQLDSKAFGSSNQRSEENPEYYSDSRLYRPGDPRKRILWKKSYQQRRLYVRQYDVPARETVFSIIDTAAHGMTGEELLKYADTVCEYAATLCLDTIRYGKAARFHFSGHPDDSLSCETADKFEIFREMLAYLPFTGAFDPEAMNEVLRSEAASYSDIVVITRDAGNDIISMLEDEVSRGKNVTLIVVGGEIRPGKVVTHLIRDSEEISRLFEAKGEHTK